MVDCKSIGFPALVRIQFTLNIFNFFVEIDFFLIYNKNIYLIDNENFNFFKICLNILSNNFLYNNLDFFFFYENDDVIFNYLYNYETTFFLKELSNSLYTSSCNSCLNHTTNLNVFFKNVLPSNKNYFVYVNNFNEVFYLNNIEIFLFKLLINNS